MSHNRGLDVLTNIAGAIKVLTNMQEEGKIEADEQVRREEQEQERREAEEKARREAEERVRREAEEKARREEQERESREAEEQERRKLAITNLQSVFRRHSPRREFEEKKRIYQATKIQSLYRGHLVRRQLQSKRVLDTERKALEMEREKIEQFNPPTINSDQQYLFFKQKKYNENNNFSFSVQSTQLFDTQKTPSEADGTAVEKKTFDQLDDQQKLKTYQDKIDQALNLAISATKDKFQVDGKTDQSNIDLPENFFVAVMQIASFNQGIGNCNPDKIKDQLSALLKNDESTKLSTEDLEKFYQASKFFSKTFQQNVEFYTGNTSDSAKRDTKMRLFRASTYENIERLFQRTCSSKSPNSALQLGARIVGAQSYQKEFNDFFSGNQLKLDVIGKATKTSIKARSASTLAPPRSLSTQPRSR